MIVAGLVVEDTPSKAGTSLSMVFAISAAAVTEQILHYISIAISKF